MIKHTTSVAALAFFCMSSNLGAMNIYNNMCNSVIGFGECIEKADVPLVGKLTNMLPFGVFTTSCKEYPGQTMLICAGLLYYILSKNDKVCSVFNTYKDKFFTKLGITPAYNVTCDDTLFIFDGDDEEDAEEQMDMEDQLLADKDASDMYRENNNRQQLFIKDTSKVKFL